MTPGERVRYRDAARQQLLLWVNGRSTHNPINGECCPDFSCCYPDIAMPMKERADYMRQFLETREPR
jgi:hypothetical protein